MTALIVCAATWLQDEAEAEGGAKSAKADRDELLMALLTEQVLPRAAELYLAGPLQVGAAALDLCDQQFQQCNNVKCQRSDLAGQLQVGAAALRWWWCASASASGGGCSAALAGDALLNATCHACSYLLQPCQPMHATSCGTLWD